MLLLLGMLEFGFAFNHQLTLGYATREGARIGADLVNGGGKLGCGTGQSPNAADVDKIIIEAVDRVLSSAGSPIPVNQVGRIRIFLATSTGADLRHRQQLGLLRHRVHPSGRHADRLRARRGRLGRMQWLESARGQWAAGIDRRIDRLRLRRNDPGRFFGGR